jgi:hypothetical protein
MMARPGFVLPPMLSPGNNCDDTRSGWKNDDYANLFKKRIAINFGLDRGS